jgi:hypothetical protein
MRNAHLQGSYFEKASIIFIAIENHVDSESVVSLSLSNDHPIKGNLVLQFRKKKKKRKEKKKKHL